MTPTDTRTTAALSALRDCRTRLGTAHVDALAAERHLAGARQERADELADKLADALAHCERLAFIVEGDLRASRGCGRPVQHVAELDALSDPEG